MLRSCGRLDTGRFGKGKTWAGEPCLPVLFFLLFCTPEYLILIYNFNADDEFYFPVQHDLINLFIEAGNFLFFSFNQVRFRLILTIFSIHDPPKGVPNGVGAL